MTYHLAHELGESVDYVKAMSPEEFTDWIAYFAVLDEKTKAANKRNGNKR